MKTRLVWVGRTRNASLSAVCQDMADRIRRLAGFEIAELRELKISDDRKRIEAEGEKILGNLGRSDYVVALDTEGRSFDSAGLAKFIGRHMAENPKDLVFVVGGPAGLSETVRNRADLSWSLSKLTFSHDLARAILMEQLYRAFSIINNLPYAR
jgi:23S rRNA (pseudouridine1915-N3)-methyltransferase